MGGVEGFWAWRVFHFLSDVVCLKVFFFFFFGGGVGEKHLILKALAFLWGSSLAFFFFNVFPGVACKMEF